MGREQNTDFKFNNFFLYFFILFVFLWGLSSFALRLVGNPNQIEL